MVGGQIPGFSTKKKGASNAPLFSCGSGEPYRFFPPFFFPPLAIFFAIDYVPPLQGGLCARSLRAAASLPSGTQTLARRVHARSPDTKKGCEP